MGKSNRALRFEYASINLERLPGRIRSVRADLTFWFGESGPLLEDVSVALLAAEAAARAAQARWGALELARSGPKGRLELRPAAAKEVTSGR
jgi:hypothetical protein